jgi:hypothetical protein
MLWFPQRSIWLKNWSAILMKSDFVSLAPSSTVGSVISSFGFGGLSAIFFCRWERTDRLLLINSTELFH